MRPQALMECVQENGRTEIGRPQMQSVLSRFFEIKGRSEMGTWLQKKVEERKVSEYER